MEFELEVCQLSKLEVVGVRRQRLKGDAWVYKRLVEDILSSCHMWLAGACAEKAAVLHQVFNHTVFWTDLSKGTSLSCSLRYVEDLSSSLDF